MTPGMMFFLFYRFSWLVFFKKLPINSDSVEVLISVCRYDVSFTDPILFSSALYTRLFPCTLVPGIWHEWKGHELSRYEELYLNIERGVQQSQ